MFNTPLADVPAVAGDADVLRARSFDINPGPNSSVSSSFGGTSVKFDQLVIGRNRRIRRTNNAQVSNPAFVNIAPTLPVGTLAIRQARGIHSPVCAAFIPRGPSTEFWFGTNHGSVYRRHNGTTTPVNPTWVNSPNPWVTDIDIVAAGQQHQ